MAEHFMFFDSANPLAPDRTYNAQEFTDYFHALITTGIMKSTGNELKVRANGSNMSTTIDTGIAFIEGRYYENDGMLALTHETESIGNNRIDRIVIRMDLSPDARNVKAFIKKGVASANPTVPPLTRTDTVYEISLAHVLIEGGQTFIKSLSVVDERGTDGMSPWAGSKIVPNFSSTSIGQPGGIATLDTSAKVPASQLRVGTTLIAGVVKLNDLLNSESVTEAATANAVKKVNDKLISFNPTIGELATASGLFGAAFGYESNSLGIFSLAVGGTSKALGAYSLAVGYGASAEDDNTVAIGPSAKSINAGQGIIGDENVVGYWKVPGSFTVAGSKNFEMPHPHPDKINTHVLRHAAVESPTAGDNLYRYTIEATTDNETVEMVLPDYFQYLNKDVDIWVNGHQHFGRAFGVVEGDILKVTCEKSGTYKVLVIGTRNDNHEAIRTWVVKGVEREIGESWTGETFTFEDDEIIQAEEIIYEGEIA